jgi:hypothetical protein
MSRSRALEAAHDDAMAAPPPEAIQACPKQSWIEIKLLDEDGVPVAREEYKVVSADGRELSGVLDANGFARVSGIEPGTCKVTFPRLHQAEWETR